MCNINSLKLFDNLETSYYGMKALRKIANILIYMWKKKKVFSHQLSIL